MSSAPPSTPKITPSGWWFVVAGVLAVIGIAAGIVVIVRGVISFGDRVEDLDRAFLPATLEVEITEPGGYSIYHEYNDAELDFRVPPDVEVTGPSGDSVPLDTYDSDVSYGISGYEGVGVYTFDADEAGTYTVDASMSFGERYDDAIAVGPGIGSGLAWSIGGGLALMAVGVIGAIVISIVVGVMRGRSRRALRPPVPAMGWAPPPGQWWQPPPGAGYGPAPPHAPGGPYAPGPPRAPGAPGWPTWPQAPAPGPQPPPPPGDQRPPPSDQRPPAPPTPSAPASPAPAPPQDAPPRDA